MPHPAVTSTSTRICVVAAPGSGKTTSVLLPRVQAILADQAVDPRTVLVLTFSRVSALDLKTRFATLPRQPRASTVHSFALGFLISENNHSIRARVESVLLE